MNRLPRLRNAIAFLVIATIIKFWFNQFLDNAGIVDSACRSEAYARSKGTFVCSVQAEPRTLAWNSEVTMLTNLWIEHKVHTEYRYIWFKRIVPTGADYLCFTTEPNNFRAVSDFPFFVCDEGDFGGSVGTSTVQSVTVFSCDLKPRAFDQHAATLKLLKNQDDPDPAVVKLTW